MAISPLEARATEAQLLEADKLEQEMEASLREPHPAANANPDGTRRVGLEFVSSCHPNIVLCIVAERFRRLGWHVAVDPTGRLTFNDATPEF